MSNEVALELKEVTKKYKKTNVISKMDLQIKNGEFLVLLGPSGCGKSTTLRMIAGLEKPSSGQILIDGQDAEKISSMERNLAMVFQDYALYPNMTVYQNLEYALKVHKVKKEERQQRLAKILETLNLTEYQDRLPGELLGGDKSSELHWEEAWLSKVRFFYWMSRFRILMCSYVKKHVMRFKHYTKKISKRLCMLHMISWKQWR